MSHRIAVLIAMFLAAVLPGCKNTPNALTMQISSQSSIIDPTKPIPLLIRLTAADGPVCLGKVFLSDAELLHIDSGQSWKSYPRYYCGTGYAISLPLFPVLFGVGLLDVFDGLDRFDVLADGEHRDHRVEVHLNADGWLSVEAPGVGFRPTVEIKKLPPGRYELFLTLAGTKDLRYVMNWYPEPLGWKTFDRPIRSKVVLVVDEGSQVD